MSQNVSSSNVHQRSVWKSIQKTPLENAVQSIAPHMNLEVPSFDDATSTSAKTVKRTLSSLFSSSKKKARQLDSTSSSSSASIVHNPSHLGDPTSTGGVVSTDMRCVLFFSFQFEERSVYSHCPSIDIHLSLPLPMPQSLRSLPPLGLCPCLPHQSRLLPCPANYLILTMHLLRDYGERLRFVMINIGPL